MLVRVLTFVRIVGSTTTITTTTKIMDENQSDIASNIVLPDIAEHLGTTDESNHGDQVNTSSTANSIVERYERTNERMNE